MVALQREPEGRLEVDLAPALGRRLTAFGRFVTLRLPQVLQISPSLPAHGSAAFSSHFLCTDPNRPCPSSPKHRLNAEPCLRTAHGLRDTGNCAAHSAAPTPPDRGSPAVRAQDQVHIAVATRNVIQRRRRFLEGQARHARSQPSATTIPTCRLRCPQLACLQTRKTQGPSDLCFLQPFERLQTAASRVSRPPAPSSDFRRYE